MSRISMLSLMCADCRIQANEVDFMPGDGNPAPWICPVCGRTEIFTVDEDQTEIGLALGQSAIIRSDEYGEVKGNRPVRVPDGLEIKTCRERIAVDCHHPHAGLHLAQCFSEVSRIFTVNDVRVAFLRTQGLSRNSTEHHSNHREVFIRRRPVCKSPKPDSSPLAKKVT